MDDPHLREFFAERDREQRTMRLIEMSAAIVVVVLLAIAAVFI